MRKPEYIPSITLGNILTIIVLLGSVVGIYVKHETRLTVLETQVPMISVTVNRILSNQEVSAPKLERLIILSEERARVSKP